MEKLVLLTNDDGIIAEGIRALKQHIGEVWNTVLVAPDREQSATSHALTLNRPLRVNRIDSHTMSVDGTPTDCVMLSLTGLLDSKPDLVISGINYGANLGDDVVYSGTVAGAAEAAVLGVPSISASLVYPGETDVEWCAREIVNIAATVMENRMPRGVFLNVNFPREWTGGCHEITILGNRSYREVTVEKIDPRGKPYYWIGGQVGKWEGTENCDFAAIERGNISITPLHLDMSASHVIEQIGSWSFSRGNG